MDTSAVVIEAESVTRSARFEPRGSLATPRGPLGFMAITRRKNGYLLPVDDAKSHQDLASYETGQAMRSDLYNMSYRLAGRANRKAVMYKVMYVLGSMYVLVCAFVVGVLSLDSGRNKDLMYAMGVLSLTVGLIKAALMTFGLEARSSKLKECGFRLRKVCAELSALESYDGDGRKLVRKVLRHHGVVDEIELQMFSNNIVTRDLAKATSIESSCSGGSNSSSAAE